MKILHICSGEGALRLPERDTTEYNMLAVALSEGSLAANVRALEQRLKAEPCELLHCRGLAALRVGARLGKRLGLPVLGEADADTLRGGWKGLRARAALRRADQWLCADRASLERLCGRGLDPNRGLLAEEGEDPACLRAVYEAVLRRRARAEARPRDGVLICGAYGRDNSGDDAILCAIVQALRERDPDLPIYATSRAPAETARRSGVGGIFIFHPWKLRQRLKRTALYLSGGGSLIQDATSSRSLWYYLFSIRAAKRLGNRVMMFGCGIGPVSRPRNRRLTARIIRAYVDRITLRDAASQAELERLGVSGVPVELTADMAFLVRPAAQETVESRLAERGIGPGERLLILAPRPWNGAEGLAEAFAAAALHGRELGLRPVLLAMEPRRDGELCRRTAALAARQGLDCPVLAEPQSAETVAALIRRADAVLAMRLHALIFAAAQGTPFGGVAYDPKVSGFLDYIGHAPCCALAEASGQRLCAMLDELHQNADAFPAAARRLRALAEQNCEEALALIE